LADSPDFSTFAALECHYLSLIYSELGEASSASRWQTQHELVTTQLHAVLWDEQAQFYNYRNFNGDFRSVLIPTGFFPLLLPNMTAPRVQALMAHLTNSSEFATPVPIPTVSRSDRTYSTNMWRGAMWINVNWFTVVGLRRYATVGTRRYGRQRPPLTMAADGTGSCRPGSSDQAGHHQRGGGVVCRDRGCV